MSYNTILATAPLTTQNYHLKMIGTSIGNSLIWDNGTNVGIGNTNTSYTLDVTGTGRFTGQVNSSLVGHSTIGLYLNSNQPSGINWYDIDDNEQYSMGIIANSGGGYWGLWSSTSSTAIDRSATTPKLVVKNSGNVGIGTGSPTFLNSSYTGMSINNSGNGGFIDFQCNGTTIGRVLNNTTNFYVGSTASVPLILTTGDAERMRITSGGALCIGGTSYGGLGISFNQSVGQIFNYSGTGVNTNIEFKNSNGTVGYIQSNGSTTAYVVTSDYRLKEDFKILNGLEKVLAIKTYDYKWKNSEDRMDGVIAHELAEVLPYAVYGEKDAEQMQGVDYSKIVPVLVKAIQEMNTKIIELEKIVATK